MNLILHSCCSGVFWLMVHHSCSQVEVSECRLSAFEMWFIVHASRMKCQYAVSELFVACVSSFMLQG